MRDTEMGTLRVLQSSFQDFVDNAQESVGRGGKMRVDTGFLRASGRASIGNVPTGPSKQPEDAPVGQYTGVYDDFDGSGGQATKAVILDLKLGDTIYFGWTAEYARARELHDGFLEASAMNWPRYVAFNTDTLKQSMKP